jgi:hypothetical protein
MENLRLRRTFLWMGNHGLVNASCEWVQMEQSHRFTLQWKQNVPNKLLDCNGQAVLSFIGMVSNNGLVVSADADFQVNTFIFILIEPIGLKYRCFFVSTIAIPW